MAVVLIVEDEDQVRVLAEGILQDGGHETLSASTAEQALALLNGAQRVDLVFTDIGLQSDIQAGLICRRFTRLAKGSPMVCRRCSSSIMHFWRNHILPSSSSYL